MPKYTVSAHAKHVRFQIKRDFHARNGAQAIREGLAHAREVAEWFRKSGTRPIPSLHFELVIEEK